MDHLGESAVLDLLRGTTAEAERGRAEAHIDACAECRELVSVLARSGVMTDPDLAGVLGLRDARDEGDELHAVDWRPGMIVEGRFLLEEAAGRGAMGTVFRALDRERQAVVALKALTYVSADATAWFTREARILSGLSHPAVVRYVAHGTTSAPQAYLAMEWLEGEDLAARLARGALPWREVVKLARRVVAGLAAAHERGIVHRDIKPSNVFLVDGDPARAVVIDFGVARASGTLVPGTIRTATRRGTLVGTPSYMAPEQARARAALDARADIFSLGCVLYECLTGARAFAGGDLLEVLAKILMETPPRVGLVVKRAQGSTGTDSERRDPLPPRFEALVSAMLQKDPALRPASCADVDAELAQLEAATGSWARAALQALPLAQAVPWARGMPRRTISTLLAVTVVIAATALLVLRLAPRDAARPAAVTVPNGAALPVVGSPGTIAPGEPPVDVLLLDFENRTTDPLFDRVAGAVLVSALDRSWKLDGYEGTRLRALAAELDEVPGPLDEHLGRELAARDGCRVASIRGVVIERGRGFDLQVSLGDTVSGELLGTFHREARERRNVVDALGLLATDVRHRLGDTEDIEPPEATGMSASLEADNELKLGIDTYDTGQQEEWMAHARRALALDPSFVKAHWVMGTLLSNLDREDDALEQLKLAAPGAPTTLSERGRLMFAGDLAGAEGDLPAAVTAYTSYLTKDPHDTPVQSRLASIYEELSDYPHAVEWARRESNEHPKEVVGRTNLIILLFLAGQLDETADEARRVLDEFPHPPALVYLALAESLATRGQTERAFAALADAERVDAPSGLRAKADLQLAQGDVHAAIASLEQALAHAGEAADPQESASTWAMLVDAHLAARDLPGARATLKRGPLSAKVATLFGLAAHFTAAGDEATARDLAAHLRAGHMPRDRHYVLLMKALTARHHGQLKEATALVQQAIAVTDTWMARRELAATYLAAGDAVHARAELQACVLRAGEGAFALSDDPTLRYLADARSTLAELDKRLALRSE